MLYQLPTAVSIIHDRQNEPSNVVSYNLSGRVHGAQIVPSVPGYTFFNGTVTNTMFSKRVKKAARSVRDLLAILGTSGPAISHEFFPAATRDNVGILPCGFISCPQTADEKKTSEMTNIFTGVQFEYPNGFSSSQYIETRLFESARQQTMELSQFNTIYINTGMCMFSRATLASAPDGGMLGHLYSDDITAVAPLPVNVEPTMYELEIIARLSCTIADILGRLSDCTAAIAVNIDIPDFQYYWTACLLLQKGLVDLDYVQKWVDAMDYRRSQLGLVLTTLIRSAMYRRGISDSNVSIQLNSGTEEAALLFEMNTAVGEVPTLERVIEALTSRGPEAAKWKTFLDSLRVQDKPTNMDELGRLAYVFKTVKTAIQADQSSPARSGIATNIAKRSLVVQVNDITDWRIFDKAKMFLKRCSKLPGVLKTDFTIMGVFPLQKIFLAGLGRSNLYEDGSLCGYFSEENDFAPLSPNQIIGQVYGSCVALELQDLFVQRPYTTEVVLNDLISTLFWAWTKWQDQSATIPCMRSSMGVGLGRYLKNSHPQLKLKYLMRFVWSRGASISARFGEICFAARGLTERRLGSKPMTEIGWDPR